MWELIKLMGKCRSMSPQLKGAVAKCLDDIEAAAAETKSPVDDEAVRFVRGVCLLLGLA